jgi:hypothetical protein
MSISNTTRRFFGVGFLGVRLSLPLSVALSLPLSLPLSVALIAVTGGGTAAQAQMAPNAGEAAAHRLRYQGVIAKDGLRVPDGSYRLAITLYRDGNGTKSVWSGNYTVQTSNGVFNVLLGAGDNPLPPAAELDGPLYVGVSIGEGASALGGELPLTQLTSAPTVINVSDSSITSRKMGTGYVGSVSVNGERFSARGSDVNFITGAGLLAAVDHSTNSIVQSASGVPSSLNAGSPLNGKGGNPETSSWIINSTSLQSGENFNIDGSGTLGSITARTAVNSGTITASASAPGTADLNVSNTSSANSTQTGAAFNVTGAGANNVGLNLNVTGGTSSNNDIIGTGGTWSISSAGNAAFAGISGGYYAPAAAASITIPITAFMVEISDPGGSHIVTITLPPVLNGKEIHIHNNTLAPTSVTGGIVIPPGGLFTIMGTGGAWMLEQN